VKDGLQVCRRGAARRAQKPSTSLDEVISIMRYTDVSRTISHALRHEPWLYELELDDTGWVPVGALLTALRAEKSAWAGLSEADRRCSSRFTGGS
jgi:RNA:NAD 2'-phosphotransferase (TPT1/KptA family)